MKANTTKITELEARINELDKARRSLEYLYQNLYYEMDTVKDENGNPVLDENGEQVRTEPAKDSWTFRNYEMYKFIIDCVEKAIK